MPKIRQQSWLLCCQKHVMKSTGKLDMNRMFTNKKHKTTTNRDQHVTTHERKTTTMMTWVKAAVPRPGGAGGQTWIGRGRYSPRGERDVAPRWLRGVTTSSCPHKKVWKGAQRTCQLSLNQVSPVSSVCEQSAVQSLFVRYPQLVLRLIFISSLTCGVKSVCIVT